MTDRDHCRICGFQRGGAEPGSRYCRECDSALLVTKPIAERMAKVPTIRIQETEFVPRRVRAASMEIAAGVAVAGLGSLDRCRREVEKHLGSRSATNRLARAGRSAIAAARRIAPRETGTLS